MAQDSGFVICSATYTYRFCRILHKEERRGRATFKDWWLRACAQFIRTTADRTALGFTKPLEASRIFFLTALFIYLLQHIAYPKALEYRVLVFSRIERSEAEGNNSEIFQKFCSSDLPISLNTRTLVYNNKRTNYATNYFALFIT